MTRRDLADAILADLGVTHVGLAHVGARRALVAWMGAESGWFTPCNGIKGARNNPLNTTLYLPGRTASKDYNSVPVRNYTSGSAGATAVALTLLSTPDQGYEEIIAALRKPFVRASTVLRAVGTSNWGTSADTLLPVLETYQRNRGTFNNVLVGP